MLSVLLFISNQNDFSEHYLDFSFFHLFGKNYATNSVLVAGETGKQEFIFPASGVEECKREMLTEWTLYEPIQCQVHSPYLPQRVVMRINCAVRFENL